MTKLSQFATVDPFDGMNSKNPGKAQNLLNGEWLDTPKYFDNIPDPLTGEYFIDIPDTEDLSDFIQNLEKCPKSGLHNPLKNNERYEEELEDLVKRCRFNIKLKKHMWGQNEKTKFLYVLNKQ